MKIPTFSMYHPKHGECVADEHCAAGLEELGWSKQAPKGAKANGKPAAE